MYIFCDIQKRAVTTGVYSCTATGYTSYSHGPGSPGYVYSVYSVFSCCILRSKHYTAISVYTIQLYTPPLCFQQPGFVWQRGAPKDPKQHVAQSPCTQAPVLRCIPLEPSGSLGLPAPLHGFTRAVTLLLADGAAVALGRHERLFVRRAEANLAQGEEYEEEVSERVQPAASVVEIAQAAQ